MSAWEICSARIGAWALAVLLLRDASCVIATLQQQKRNRLGANELQRLAVLVVSTALFIFQVVSGGRGIGPRDPLIILEVLSCSLKPWGSRDLGGRFFFGHFTRLDCVPSMSASGNVNVAWVAMSHSAPVRNIVFCIDRFRNVTRLLIENTSSLLHATYAERREPVGDRSLVLSVGVQGEESPGSRLVDILPDS